MIPILSVAGKSDSGKTFFIEQVVSGVAGQRPGSWGRCALQGDVGRNPMRNSGVQENRKGFACSGAVLAGGESRRFGQDKAHAMLGGKPLVSHVVEAIQPLFEDVLIVANQPVLYHPFDVTVVSDIVRGAGSLGGLWTALVHAKAERCFVVACDMPFVNAEVIRRMLGACEGYDVVVPVLKGELEPLHAVYSKRCMAHIEERIAQGDFRIFDFYPKVPTLRLEEGVWEDLDPENRSFSNINTRDELVRAEQWIQGVERP